MRKKLISLLLTIVLFTTGIIGNWASAENSVELDIIDPIVNKGMDAINTTAEFTGDSRIINRESLSGQWEEYVGDIEVFAYGLIINQLGYLFDVFPACVDLPEGDSVYGIAYTDYSNCYTNEDETVYCYEAGFIPYNGELSVSKEDFDSGLIISNLDNIEGQASFLWAYASEPIKEHCVVYNHYLQYGIDENGVIFYKASEYVPGECDESLGSLYSYDEAKFLFDIDVGSYIRITGTSLYTQIDFDELEREINKILETQDINAASVDLVTCAYFSQEAVVSYLLSLQEETFLGYDVDELIEAAKQLDPLECYRITADGLVTLKLEEGTKATDLTKWIVGSVCAVVAAVAMVGSVVFVACPGLSMLSGAVAGAAVEMFMQVVISEKDLSSVDWRKVALGAVAGAVSGYIGPYLYATFGGAAYFMTDSAIDGLIGGVERAVEAWMDGADASQIFASFGTGVALGFAISAGFKGLFKCLPKLIQKISPGVRKFAEKHLPKLTKKLSSFAQGLSKATEPIKKKIGTAIQSLKKWAEETPFYNSELADKQLRRMLMNNVDELVDNSVKRLSVDDIVDLDGNSISKKMLKNIAADAKDETILAYFKKGDELIQIVKKNSMVGIVFDPGKYQSVSISGGLTVNRSINMNKAAEVLQEQWIKDPSKIPGSIAKAIEDSGMELEEMMTKDLVNIIQKSDWVIHENIDLITATLVPRALHEAIRHSGGVSLAKYVESRVAEEFFDKLVYTASTNAVIAVH